MQGNVLADRKVRKGRGSCPQGPVDFSDTEKVKGRVSLVVGGRSFLFFFFYHIRPEIIYVPQILLIKSETVGTV